MSHINVGRVVAGGLVAGLVANVIDFVVNVPILGARWDEGLRGLGLDPEQGSPLGWIVGDFLFGLAMVWLYAAIRPRFGPGPKTALLAAVAVWAIAHIAYASFLFLGLLASDLVIASALGGLVAWVVGGMVGAWIYKEA